MFRTSIYLCLFSIIILTLSGTIVAQEKKTFVIGPHIEWSGIGKPVVKVVEGTRIIRVVLTQDKDCVTVYSPATDRDYTYEIATPNGKVMAQRPHANGFQATFCYNIVGDDRIVRAHVILGGANFQSVDGRQGVLKTGQVINIILPRSGKIRMQEGDEIADSRVPSGKKYYEEYYGNYETVLPRDPYGKRVKDVPTPVKPKVVIKKEVKKQIPMKKVKKVAVIKKNRLELDENKVDVPAISGDVEKVKPIKLETGEETTDEELAKYYGKEKVKKKKKQPRWKKWVGDPFVLDHSTDDKFKIAGWFGVARGLHEGEIRFDGYTARGTKLSILDFLEVREDDMAHTGGVELSYQNARLGFDVKEFSYSGTTVTTEDIWVDNYDVPMGSIVSTTFRYSWYRAYVGYTMYLKRNLGIGFDLYGEYYRFKYTFSDHSASRSVSATVEGIFPAGGLHLKWSPEDRWLFTLGSYGTYFELNSHNMWKGNFNAQVQFFICPYNFIFVKGEWEISQFEINERRFEMDTSFRSTWALSGGIGIRF